MKQDHLEHIYRIDKFIVPEEARAEFLDKVKATHALLQAQPGFVQDLVLEQSAGPGKFNFVTMVEWESEAVVAQARTAVAALHQQMNFNPQALFAQTGITADVATYRKVSGELNLAD